MIKYIQRCWAVVVGAPRRPAPVPMTYLQSLWGDSVDNPTHQDVLHFIEQIKLSDDEHGAFWVGLADERHLEVHRNLEVILTDAEGNETRHQATKWEEVQEYFRLFAQGRSNFIN